MLKRLRLLLFIFLAGVVAYACEDTLSGDFNENQPPRTFLAIDNINLPEDERLASRVDVEWWGDDPDGYVVAYEICIGDEECDPGDTESENWEYTESTDTTLVLPIPEGEEIADVKFNVRAIDNEGLRDPEGASVIFPIENSPPEINFDPTQTPPDTTYSYLSFGFEATDPDGDEDLNFIEINVNDPDEGEWVELDPETGFVTLEIDQDNMAEDGTYSAEVFVGRALNTTGEFIDGIELNSDNTLNIRAFDQSLAESNIAEFEWYIKEQTSNILFINDVEGATEGDRQFHSELLANAGYTEFDYWEIAESLIPAGDVLPTPIDPTLNNALAKWDHIYWVSDDLEHNFLFALEATIEFFDQGGTMFVNIPSRTVSSQNEEAVFSLLPTNAFEDPPPGQQRFTLPFGSELIPLIDELDPLELSTGYANINPMIPDGDAHELYDGDFSGGDDHDFSKLLSGITEDQSVVYFGITLRDFTEESPLEETLQYLLDQLEFENP